MFSEVTIIDKLGNRRKAKKGEMLQDGETLYVPTMAIMDGKPADRSTLIDAAIKLAGSRDRLAAATSQLLDGGSDLTSLQDTTIKLGAIMCWDAAHASEHRMRPAAFIDAFFDSACSTTGITASVPAPQPTQSVPTPVAPSAADAVNDYAVTLADAKARAEAAREQSIADMCNAWKKGPPAGPYPANVADRYAGLSDFDRHRQDIADRSGGAGPLRDVVSLEDARARSEAARDAYVQRVTNAWRKPLSAA